MAANGVALAFLIEGLRNPLDPTDTRPVAFTQGDLGGGCAALGAPLSGAVLLPWIPLKKGAVGGFQWIADPLKPFGEGSPVTVEVYDTGGDRLGPAVGEDFGDAVTNRWYLKETRLLSRAGFSTTVYGPTFLAEGQLLWLGPELVSVTGVIPAGDGISTDVTITRALGGSRARLHRLRPKRYPGTEDGQYSRLYLYDRIPLDSETFPATLYQIKTTGNTAASAIKIKRGVVRARPVPKGKSYVFTMEDFSTVLGEHVFSGDSKEEVALSRAIFVRTLTPAGGVAAASLGAASSVHSGLPQLGLSTNGAGGQSALRAEAYLDRGQAEGVLGEVFHTGDSPEIDQTFLAATLAELGPCMDGTIPIYPLLYVAAGGWEGLYRIRGAEYDPAAYGPSGAGQAPTTGVQDYVKLELELEERWEGSVADQAIITSGDAGIYDPTNQRFQGFNAGWSEFKHDPLRPGEDPPRVALWWGADGLTPFEALSYLYLSDTGDGSNDTSGGNYDAVPCGFGLGEDPAKLDYSAAVPAVAAVAGLDPGTTNLQELAALLPKRQRYIWPRSGDWSRLKTWLNNECLRTLTAWAERPTTGKVGLRQLDRASPVADPGEVITVKGPLGIVPPGQRLPRVEALRIEVGWRGKTLEAQDFRTFRLLEADTEDRAEARVTIRLWERGNVFAPAALNNGPIPRIFGYYARQLHAGPAVFKAPASIQRGAHVIGDFVRYSNPSLQTARGRGISGVICTVGGIDNDPSTGIETLLLLPYALTLLTTATGKIAPALRVIAVEPLGGVPARYRLYVQSIGDPGVDLRSAYGGLFQTLQGFGAFLRVVNPKKHNPTGAQERRGWAEAYGQLAAVGWTGTLSYLELTFSAAWTRGAVNLQTDILAAPYARVLLSDVRPAASNVSGLDFIPRPEMRANSGSTVFPAAALGPKPPTTPYDRVYYLYT